MKRMLTMLLLAAGFIAAHAQMPDPNKVQKKTVKKVTDTTKQKVKQKVTPKEMPTKKIPKETPTPNMPGDKGK